jgi:hypothetical protein
VADAKAISTRERTTLIAVTRTHFKVLRAELDASKADLMAEVDRTLAERARARSTEMREVQEKINAVTEQANRLLQEAMGDFDAKFAEGSWGRPSAFYPPHAYRKDREDLAAVRKAAVAGIAARIQRAKVDVSRQEAELLRDLAVDGLESDRAKDYVRALPTADAVLGGGIVAELVGSDV